MQKQLRKAAKKVVKEIDAHFAAKKNGGWPISYSQEVQDVFYFAFGHHLETYLLAELRKRKKYALIVKEMQVMITKKAKKGSKNANRVYLKL